MVGKYTDFPDAYKSLNEALIHAGIQTETRVRINYLPSEKIEKEGVSILKEQDAIIIPGGFGERGIEGMVLAAQYARENNVPYFGICLGLHIALIEFARHKAGMEDANSTEFDKNTPYPVVGLITEWLDQAGRIQKRHEKSDLGGTMRLGGQLCKLKKGSRTYALYNKDEIIERHRHRYEVNNHLVATLEKAGLIISGRSADGSLVEMIELSDHSWFIACQFHPEFTSNPRDGHPLFTGFIRAARDYKEHSI